MFRPLWAASVRTRYFLRRYMPTNVLLDLIHTRRGLKWGVPAMLIAAPYLLAVAICAQVVKDGGPSWLDLFVILFTWNSLKFLFIGPSSAALLFRARLRERIATK
jgi:hypothetical protein